MRIKLWFGSKMPRIYRTTPYTPKSLGEHPFTHRQELIPGFDQAALSSQAVFIGAGGLNSWPALGLVQAGIRKVTLCDRDTLEVSNCNRQFYRPADIGRFKVDALGRELARFGAGETTIESFPYHFEDMVALYGKEVFITSTVAVIGVDNEESRVRASRHFRALGIPAIFSGVCAEGKTGFVFIQSPTGPCYGCVFPQVVKTPSAPTPATACAPTPAISPILHAVSGLALEAIFAVLMPKLYHDCNYFYLCIDSSLPSGGSMRKRRLDCELCAQLQDHPQTPIPSRYIEGRV
jgi:molybdopterin/thiamine biosynthesis adenylyltransferase